MLTSNTKENPRADIFTDRDIEIVRTEAKLYLLGEQAFPLPAGVNLLSIDNNYFALLSVIYHFQSCKIATI